MTRAGRSPLTIASYYGHKEITQILLKYKENLHFLRLEDTEKVFEWI